MRALVIADREEMALWDFYQPSRLEGIDLILAAGDLKKSYLEFLVTMSNLPLFYVRGNHDESYHTNPPEGCICVDGSLVKYKGIRIFGLGGSRKYGSRPDMYTEQEMKKRILKSYPRLYFAKGFDILLTHAPCRGYGDQEDLPHQGFECFNDLLQKYHPQYMVHGHVHQEYGDFKRELIHDSGTKIINACGRFVIDIKEEKE